MIVYLDTSAVVPLLIREPSSESCLNIWNDSDDAVTSVLTYVEAAAALAQALRNRRMTAVQHRLSLVQLDAFWAQCDEIDVDHSLATSASTLAQDFSLRGYDAVHCASAILVRDADLVAVSGDRKLLSAWTALGVATFDVNSPATAD